MKLTACRGKVVVRSWLDCNDHFARRMRGALIKPRHFAAHHQPHHILPFVLRPGELARELAVAQHDDAVGEFLDLVQAGARYT